MPNNSEQRLQDTPSSGHAPLAHTLPPQMLRRRRPTLCTNQPTQRARTVLSLPVSKAALLELKTTLEERLALTAEHLRQDSHTLRKRAESRHASGEPTDGLREEMDTLWHERAHDTCVAAKYALRCASERPSHLEVPRFPTGTMQNQRQEESAAALQDLWNTFNNCHGGERSQQQWVTHLEAAKAAALRDMRELQRARPRGRAAAPQRARNRQPRLDTAPGRAHKETVRPKAEHGTPALRTPGR